MQFHRLKIMMAVITLLMPPLVMTPLALREKQVAQGRVSGNLVVSLPSDFGHAISSQIQRMQQIGKDPSGPASHCLFLPFVFISKLFTECIILCSVPEVGKNPHKCYCDIYMHFAALAPT